MKNKNIILSLTNYSTLIRIGVTENERLIPKKVTFNIKFFFSKLPLSCNNDELNDTICYNHIAQIINLYCENNEVKLIEKLCFDIFNLLRAEVNSNIKIWIKIIKHNPLTDNSLQQAEFEFSDL
jgi:dihydroneopterin aldolase